METPLMDSGIIVNPNLLSRLLPDINSLTYAALVLAAVAAFCSLIRRTHLVIIRLPKGKSVIPHPPTYFSDSDDLSSSSDDEESEAEADDDADSVDGVDGKEEHGSFYGDYVENEGQNGKSEEKGFWPELPGGGDVVKFWDGLGLGFRTSDAGGLVSLLDLGREAVIRSFPAGRQMPTVFMESPAMILSAAAERAGTLAVRAWDARAGGSVPAVATVWGPRRRRRRIAGITGGEGKVFVHDGAGEVSVVDLRNSAAVAVETWWDADAVFVGNDKIEDGVAGNACGGSVASWCRNAARCFPVLPSSS